MNTLLAGVLGAVIGLLGVAVGAWQQGRKEHQRWLRDQKLRAAVDFIGATGDIYDQRREAVKQGTGPADESIQWHRAQDGRSAVHLLCDDHTVDLAESLVVAVRHFIPGVGGSHDEAIISMLRELVQHLRVELGAGMG